MSKERQLIGSWTLFYHLPDDKKWTISSYPVIMNKINTVEKVIAINREIADDTIRFNMLFLMIDGVTPTWEDKQNRNGGCFSYRVPNNVVPGVWKNLVKSLCGHTLTVNKNDMKYVTGITISPKTNFCIIKIWLRCCTLQDTSLIIDIENLPKIGSFFRKHAPEY
jgi:hypothetical protein